MEISLSAPQQDFVKQAVRDGRYSSESDVVAQGLRLVEARDRKLAELRARLQAAIDEGGFFTAEEMDADLDAQCAELLAEGIPW